LAATVFFINPGITSGELEQIVYNQSKRPVGGGRLVEDISTSIPAVNKQIITPTVLILATRSWRYRVERQSQRVAKE
jgi:hypothetical protein